MPYCWKCGAKLDEDAKFCHVCGAAVGLPATEPRIRRKAAPMSPMGIILIAIIAVAAVLVGLTFLPVYEASPVSSQMSVPRKPSVDTLNLNLAIDVGYVNIRFENLTGEPQSPSIIINASAAERVPIFSSKDPLNRYMPVSHNETAGNVLKVTVEQKVDTIFWPMHSSLNVTFDVRIDPSMKTSLNIKTSTGGILLDTQAGVILNSTILQATTGGVEAKILQDTVVAGDVSVKTITGGVKLSWNNPTVTNDVNVNATTTTGGVDVTLTQHGKLSGNITLKAEAVTGGVNFAVDIKNDIGTKIQSTVKTGGIDIYRQEGFSGTENLLQSNNYPAGHNINATLKTTTGGIRIDAEYTP